MLTLNAVALRVLGALIEKGTTTPEHYPLIDLQRGGTVQGIIDALNRILEITVPAKYQASGKN